jgi:ribonucleoside-diphosphate reductase alpha chain
LTTLEQAPVDIPKATLDAFGGDELRARVFYEKYSLRDAEGKQIEKTPQEMWKRLAQEIAGVENKYDIKKFTEWEQKFNWLLEDFKFVPGGRIMFGAGQSRKSTLLNCYVNGIKDDSIEAIFEWCKEAARTYSYGGGVGTDISMLRPKGTPVNNSAIYSTGAVSFMELFSTTTGTIGQAGRRGALMITMSVDHPDILDFINVKKNLSKVNYANISVRITDEFMKAVEANADFALHFKNTKVEYNKTVRAREIWNELVRAAWQSAEPGVMFWDTLQRNSTTSYNGMTPISTNPCGEIPLEDGGCCCLGSINLSKFVTKPFTAYADVDWESLSKAAAFATRFLDDILDYNADKHPLSIQKTASLKSRRIGVGVTGLADMLIKLSIKYDSEEALKMVDEVMSELKFYVYKASIDLAVEKGSFEGYDAEKHLAQSFIKSLPQKLQDDIKTNGIRNAAIMTVPPVGSGSILVGSSSGIEPIFALSYKRRSKSMSKGEFEVNHPLLQQYIDWKYEGTDVPRADRKFEMPSFFVTSHDIKPEFRVRMQATVQKHIDQSISSTVNLPQDITLDEVEKIYMLAWKEGCKGITVYREGSREGILETDNVSKVSTELKQDQEFERPKTMEGKTMKMKIPQGSLYVTVNYAEGDGPKEVFVELGKLGGDEKADAEALGRLVSLYLQQGGKMEEVIKSLKGIKGKYTSWDDGMQMQSVPDAVAKALEMMTTGKVTRTRPDEEVKSEMCPDCRENALLHENGCVKCSNCGYSRCE